MRQRRPTERGPREENVGETRNVGYIRRISYRDVNSKGVNFFLGHRKTTFGSKSP